MPRDWNKFMGGAFAEKMEQAMDEVAENILDPNYPAKGKRKIIATFILDPDEERDLAEGTLDVKTVLVARKSVKRRMLFNRDSKGKAGMAELNSADPNQLELVMSDEGATEVQANNGVDLLQRI